MDTYEAKHSILITLLVNVLGDFRKHSTTNLQMAFNCPMCASLKNLDSDNKYNLEVHYGKGVYKCWACGASHGTHGTIYDLFKNFGTYQEVTAYQNLGMEYSYIAKDGKEVSHKEVKIYIPPEFISLVDKDSLGVYREAFNYLKKRKITNDVIKKYGIGWCYDGKYENRILIPSIDNDGNWDYFTTRSFNDKVKPKYMNCDADKESIVFNVNLIDWTKWVFVVEGPFDQIVTPNSLTMLGKGIYPLLHQTIYENAENKVVILVDPDAVDAGVKFYRQLDGGKLLGKVLINFLPKYYDPAKFYEKFGYAAYTQQLIKSYRLKD